MDGRRARTTSTAWDQQYDTRFSVFKNVRMGDGTLGQLNGEFCISQLIQQLEELNLTKKERSSKNALEKCINLGDKLPPAISKAFLPTLNKKTDQKPLSATCCSHLESNSPHGRLQRDQLDLKCNKNQRFWLHPPKRKYLCTPRASQGGCGDMAQGDTPLRITPAIVTHSPRLGDRRMGDGLVCKSMDSSAYCLAENRYEGCPAGTRSGSSTTQGSSSLFTEVPSDDSDLSDQEKASVMAQEWLAPVELDLRPEQFNKHDSNDYLQSAEDQSHYPDVLPAPFMVLDPMQTLSNRVDLERRESLHREDPSLYAIVRRLTEMERMQATTIQRERTKLNRPRPVTAIRMTRSATRIRKADIFESKPDSPVPAMQPEGDCPSVLSGLADLALSRAPMVRRRLKSACVSSKQSYDIESSNVTSTLPRQPSSSSIRPSKTNFLSGQPTGEGLSLKAKPNCKGNRPKGSKKATSRPKRKTSCTPRKKTGPDRKL